MTYTVLDIGAGSRTFGKQLANENRHLRMTVFCGEPEWGLGPFFRAIPDRKKERILSRGIPGIWRVTSSYLEFAFPDESIDLVTLNAPHPFSFEVYEIANELKRCLKPGGMFFSSYPRSDLSSVPSEFRLLKEGAWDNCVGIQLNALPRTVVRRFPQSPFVRHNILVHRYGDPRSMGSQYIYFDGISPGFRLWQKPV